MGSKWIECELGDFIELKRGYDLPKSTRNEGSIPIISSSGFTDFHDRPMVKGPGVVTGRYGTIGEVFYSEEDFWPLNTTLYVVDFKGNDPLFVYYLLQTISYADYTDKAAVPGVNRNHLHKAKVKVPISLDIQQKVAAQLYQLEKRVTLGKQINQTLEQMSQTLFKSWFVDFDPVIDNALDAGNPIPEALQSRAELRQKVRNSADFKPLPADIRVLFPAEFEETELGYAPKGWVTNRLENILELAYGKALKKTERTNGNYPVYGSGGVDGTHNEYLVKGPGVIVGRKGTVGSLHWENKNFYPIDTVFFVKPKEYYPLVYCYQLLKTLGLENMNTDAAVPGLNRNNAYRLEVVTPTQSIIAKFTNIIQTIQHKMDSNHNETENLTALRDTLLPKLISGELSLEDLPDLVTQTEPA
ncbi:restriction endonuclease subunit S [Klebsiella quasipneumoniae subsp. quasipneumoniae]|uniref:restriction endonuclease subunit S n=1 Tax=Klebsiella quasipneumoniae TaxID=1463165 RepID=UPI003006A02A